MIDYSKLDIDNQVLYEILRIDNSCGVVTCYILSLIYDFKFNVKEFRNIGLGLTDFDIQNYAGKNGLNYICKEVCGNKSTVSFVDFDVLCENNIAMTLSGVNISNGNPHNSIVAYFKGDDFTQFFCNPNNCIKKFSEVKGYYPTFYFKNIKISNFVWFH